MSDGFGAFACAQAFFEKDLARIARLRKRCAIREDSEGFWGASDMDWMGDIAEAWRQEYPDLDASSMAPLSRLARH